MKVTKKTVTQEVVNIEMSLEDYRFIRDKLFYYDVLIPERLNELERISDSEREKLSDLMRKLWESLPKLTN